MPHINNKQVLPKWVVYLFFIIGLISAAAMRLLIVVTHLDPIYVRSLWYFGVIGYFFFFGYRFMITRKRKRMIKDNRLIEKVEQLHELDSSDKESIQYILLSIQRSPEMFNYFFIFSTSLVAIALDIFLTYFGK